jgi:hypothetical protein
MISQTPVQGNWQGSPWPPWVLWPHRAGPQGPSTPSRLRRAESSILGTSGGYTRQRHETVLRGRDFPVPGRINELRINELRSPFGPAKGIFINIVAVAPSGHGHLTVYPYPLSLPLASTLNFSPGQNIANGMMVPICDTDVSNCQADFTITMGPAAAHIVIDVTGYLLPTP